MRYLLGFTCVLALCAMGCDQSTAGSGGDGAGGEAGSGGTAGTGGSPGVGGTGGTAGMGRRGAGGPVAGSLYLGTVGDPFNPLGDDPEYAVCLWVDEQGMQLVRNAACNVSNGFFPAYAFNIEVANGVGTPGCDFAVPSGGGPPAEPIDEDGKFSWSEELGFGFSYGFEGTVDGNAASGSARFTSVMPLPDGVDCSVEWTAKLVAESACLGVDDVVACTLGDSSGSCLDDICRPADCSNSADRTVCALIPSVFADFGWCNEGSCSVAVSDCTGVEDGAACVRGELAYCVDGSCEPGVVECTGVEDGTPCRLGMLPGPDGGGLCIDGSCERPE